MWCRGNRRRHKLGLVEPRDLTTTALPRHRRYSEAAASAVRVGLAFALAYATMLGGTWVGIYYVDVRVLSLGMAVLILGTWVVVSIRVTDWRPRTALAAAIPALGVSWAISTLLSRFPRVSFEYAAWAVLLGALYLLLVQILRRSAARRLLGFTALAVVAIVTAVYLGRVVQLWVEWWGLSSRPGSLPLRPAFESLSYGNPSAVLTVTLLLWLGGGAVLLPLGKRGVISMAVLGVGVAVVALISGSRSGWLAVVVAIVVGAVVWAMAAKPAIARYPRRLMVVAAAVLVAGSGAAVFFLPSVLARLSAGGEVLRLAYAAAASRMFHASPLIGTGPGTWTVQRAIFTTAYEPDGYIPHAHNAYLQTLAEFGLFGALAGLVAGLVIGRLIWAAVRCADPVGRGIGMIAVVASVYFAIHNLLDFYINMPAALLAWILPIALLDARTLGDVVPSLVAKPQTSTTGRQGGLALARLGLVAAIAVASVGLGASERVALIGDSAANFAGPGEWQDAYVLASEAARIDPEMPAYQVTLGLAAEAVGRPLEAATAFRSAAERDDLPETWLDLAAVETELGRTAGARANLSAALRLGRQQAPVALGAAIVYLRLKDPTSANDALVASLIAAPSLAADRAWHAIADEALGFDRVLADALHQTAGEVAWEIALMGGDPTAAAARISTLGQPDRQTAELATSSFGGSRDALLGLVAYALDHPFDRFALDWAGRAAREAGRLDVAARIRRVSVLATNDATVGYAARVTWSNNGLANVGDSTTFYGLYTYRRLTPLNKFVLSLPSIEFVQ